MSGLLDEYGAVTANRGLLNQAQNARNAIPRKQLNGQGLLDAAAIGLSPVPVIGDLLGLGADANRFVNEPESRTPLNFGLAALGLLPLVPSAAGAVKKMTKFEKAHEIAQKNAALPVSQGGLGLPPNNTAMDRAAAMNAYDYNHGTQRIDRLLEKNGINNKRATSGPMPFGTDDKTIASNYAMSKPDTSRMQMDDGNLRDYFQVSPKQLGFRGTAPYSVEQSYNFLPSEKKKELLENYYRLGYENVDEATGPFKLHPPGADSSIASKSHLDYVLQSERGNPLSALRALWGESGAIGAYDQSALADIYRVAGYPHEISQANAPWYEARGVLTGKAMINSPLNTSNTDEIQKKVIPELKAAFKNDRTRLKPSNSDQWAKDSRYTPKDWVDTLEKDILSGNNSYVWTSIPDKVSEKLKALGYDGILDTGGKASGQGHQVVIPFNPEQVRSKFAAFDPMRRNENNLLANVAPFGLAGLLGLSLMNSSEAQAK